MTAAATTTTKAASARKQQKLGQNETSQAKLSNWPWTWILGVYYDCAASMP